MVRIAVGIPDRRDLFDLYEKGIDAFREGKIFDAYHCFRRVSLVEPDYRNVQYYLAVTEREKDRVFHQLDSLLADWDEPTDLEYEDHHHLLHGARKAWQAGDFDTSSALLKEYQLLSPDEIPVLLLLFQADRERRSFQECFSTLERLLVLVPNDIRPYKLGGNLYIELGFYDDARALYLRALRYLPESPDILNNLGTLHLELGLLDEAASYLTQALVKKPEYARAARNLDTVQQRILHYDKKIQEAKATLSEHPKYPDLHFRLGRSYQSRGFLEAARESYLNALNLNTHYIEALYYLGETYESEGNFLHSHDYWQKIVEIRGLEEDPLYQKSVRLCNEGLNQEGIVQLKRVVQIQRDISSDHIEAGKVCYYQAQFEEAEEEFRKAVLLNPSYPDGHHRLAMCLIATGRLVEARNEIQEGMKLRPQMPELYYHRGIIHYRLGEFAAAFEDFSQSLRFGLGKEFQKVCANLLKKCETAPSVPGNKSKPRSKKPVGKGEKRG